MNSSIKTLSFAMIVAAGMTGCDKKADTTSSSTHPTDAVRQTDGTYRYADGSVRNADGSIKTAAPIRDAARDSSATRDPAMRDSTTRDPALDKPVKPDAMSQGNNQADIDVTAAIRKAVLAREGMSMAGKNAVIVTEKGTITLKGEVATAAEKATIGEIAAANAAGRTVDNQIVVKP